MQTLRAILILCALASVISQETRAANGNLTLSAFNYYHYTENVPGNPAWTREQRDYDMFGATAFYSTYTDSDGSFIAGSWWFPTYMARMEYGLNPRAYEIPWYIYHRESPTFYFLCTQGDFGTSQGFCPLSITLYTYDLDVMLREQNRDSHSELRYFYLTVGTGQSFTLSYYPNFQVTSWFVY